MEIEQILKGIKANGPDRVVINEYGDAVPSQRAREAHNITPIIIFIRHDGWSLGAPDPYERIAYELWKDEWSHVLLQSGDCMTIEDFLQAMDDLNKPKH